MFASGARDGCVLVWDTRRGRDPVSALRGVHTLPEQAGSKRKRATPPQSVSSVVYLPSSPHTLVTGGASDGAIKLWDSRYSAKAKSHRSEPRPLQVLAPQTGLGRPHGIVCLAVDPAHGRVLASSTDNTIYLYDTVRQTKGGVPRLSGEVSRLTGVLIDSFYVKAAFSPDGRFVVSGSSDSSVYLFEARLESPAHGMTPAPNSFSLRPQVDRPAKPALALRGHCGEVTGVDWCRGDFCTLASCSDDTTVRVWHR